MNATSHPDFPVSDLPVFPVVSDGYGSTTTATRIRDASTVEAASPGHQRAPTYVTAQNGRPTAVPPRSRHCVEWNRDLVNETTAWSAAHAREYPLTVQFTDAAGLIWRRTGPVRVDANGNPL